MFKRYKRRVQAEILGERQRVAKRDVALRVPLHGGHVGAMLPIVRFVVEGR